MSYPGRQVIAHIDAAEAKIEAGWWRGYADRLTPVEKRRLRDGGYSSFRRPHRPAFGPGDWLRVSPHLRVRVLDVQPHNGRYRIRLDRVEDFRVRGPRIKTHGGEDYADNTLAILGNPRPPEPEGVGPAELDEYARRARNREADDDARAIAA